MTTDGKFEKLGQEAGAMVERRHAKHGDTYARAGSAMRLLFPKGIPSEQMNNALFLSRIWDQMVKASQDEGTESPYNEILLLSLEALRHDDQRREAAKVVQIRPVSPADLPCDACGRGPHIPTCGTCEEVLVTDLEKATATCTSCTNKLAKQVEPALPDHAGPIPGDLLTHDELLRPRNPNGAPK